MTQSLPSTINAKQRLWAAIGGPLDLWSIVMKGGGELSWVFAGKLALMGSNALVMLFLANRLALNTYGLLVLTISGQLLISRLLLVGVDSGIVRLTAVPDLRARAQQVVTAGLLVIGCTSGVLVLATVLAIPLAARAGTPAWLLLCVAAGTIGIALVDYGYSFRLARNEYPAACLAQGGTAVWRFGLTLLAAVKLPSNPVAVFAAYHGASLISGVIQMLLIAKETERTDRALIKRLLGYSYWIGKANVIVIFSLYQGTFLLMMLNQPAATGFFGLGLTLSLGFFAIYNAYSEYLAVRVRAVEHISDVPRFMKRAMAAALVLMLACIPIAIVIAALVPWLLGPEWREVPIFVLLSASMVLLIFQAPFVAVCQYLLKPHLITLGWVLRVILIGVVGFILAPQMGAIGAAIAQLIGSVLALIVLSWLVVNSLRTAMAAGDHA
jgi:O-antigen/teichoic acid export membrane protein